VGGCWRVRLAHRYPGRSGSRSGSPEASKYIFQTRGFFGACAFAGVPDTVLDLYAPGGAHLESNDDEPGQFTYCSRIERVLEPGAPPLYSDRCRPNP